MAVVTSSDAFIVGIAYRISLGKSKLFSNFFHPRKKGSRLLKICSPKPRTNETNKPTPKIENIKQLRISPDIQLRTPVCSNL